MTERINRDDGYITTDLIITTKSCIDDVIKPLDGKSVDHIGAQIVDGQQRHLFNTHHEMKSPADSIDVILTALERLDTTGQELLTRCKIELSVGLRKVDGFAQEHSLSNGLLARIARVGATLSFVVYHDA